MSGILIPDLRFPVLLLHSGILQTVNSFTAAGAVLASPESTQSALASRLTFKEITIKAPNVIGVKVTEMVVRYQAICREVSKARFANPFSMLVENGLCAYFKK